jgi:plasmid maintenance system antidote protein VapI
MREITNIRRENARHLAEVAGSPAAFARKLGLEDARVSHIIGKSPTRSIGNKMAERIEDAFAKPRGWLDKEREESSTNHPAVKESAANYTVNRSTFQLAWTSDDERDLLTEFRMMDAAHQLLLMNFAKKLEKDQTKRLDISKVAN